ncbi:MAG: hypothetical protein HLUCCO03_10635 [Marinobacter sp. HL-58]|nr:MAG: hypothetical protein HLUCCO03_10635 [Marinobacter sp. HL-58]
MSRIVIAYRIYRGRFEHNRSDMDMLLPNENGYTLTRKGKLNTIN